MKIHICLWSEGKIKKNWKVTSYTKSKQIQLKFMQSWVKNPLMFGHVGGENKKIMKCQFFV